MGCKSSRSSQASSSGNIQVKGIFRRAQNMFMDFNVLEIKIIKNDGSQLKMPDHYALLVIGQNQQIFIDLTIEGYRVEMFNRKGYYTFKSFKIEITKKFHQILKLAERYEKPYNILTNNCQFFVNNLYSSLTGESGIPLFCSFQSIGRSSISTS
ncbi:hypothetical protein ABPG74_020735 [Tetrahymena malaccensis]